MEYYSLEDVMTDGVEMLVRVEREVDREVSGRMLNRVIRKDRWTKLPLYLIKDIKVSYDIAKTIKTLGMDSKIEELEAKASIVKVPHHFYSFINKVKRIVPDKHILSVYNSFLDRTVEHGVLLLRDREREEEVERMDGLERAVFRRSKKVFREYGSRRAK